MKVLKINKVANYFKIEKKAIKKNKIISYSKIKEEIKIVNKNMFKISFFY